jgi:hypothetical protein
MIQCVWAERAACALAHLLHCYPTTRFQWSQGDRGSGIQALVAQEKKGAYSVLLFLAEFLEARIFPERIEHGIEPEQRGSERHTFSQRASIRYRK